MPPQNPQTTKSRNTRKPPKTAYPLPLFATVDWQRALETGVIPPPEQILSTDEAAVVLRRSRSAIYFDISRGLLPRHIRGRSLYFFWEDLETYLANGGDPATGVTYARRHWIAYCQKRLERMQPHSKLQTPDS